MTREIRPRRGPDPRAGENRPSRLSGGRPGECTSTRSLNTRISTGAWNAVVAVDQRVDDRPDRTGTNGSQDRPWRNPSRSGDCVWCPRSSAMLRAVSSRRGMTSVCSRSGVERPP